LNSLKSGDGEALFILFLRVRYFGWKFKYWKRNDCVGYLFLGFIRVLSLLMSLSFFLLCVLDLWGCSYLFCFVCLFIYFVCLLFWFCLFVLCGKEWFLVCCSFLFSLRVVPSLFLFKGYCIFLSVYPVAVNILSIMFQIVGLLIRPVYMSLLKRIWMIVLISSVCAILLLCVLFCGSSFVIFSILVLRYWS